MAAVLVVDDQAHLRTLVRDILEMAGHAVTEAHDGRSAAGEADLAPPDLVVVDLMLPDGRGTAVVDAMRRKGMSAPALYISGDLQALDEAELGTGDACLRKPFGVVQLIDQVARMVG